MARDGTRLNLVPEKLVLLNNFLRYIYLYLYLNTQNTSFPILTKKRPFGDFEL